MANEIKRAARPIYLDYHATTPVDPRVLEFMVATLRDVFGNAHSRDHVVGDQAEAVVEGGRTELARLVGAAASEVVLTSGATEAVNLALVGFAQANARRGTPLRFVVSAAEHLAVLDTSRWLAQAGQIDLRVAPVDRYGHVILDELEVLCRGGADLVAVMAANNEVGTVSRLDTIAAIAHSFGAILMTDATQAVGKIPLPEPPNAPDLLCMSAHKMYGPKGVGALVVRKGVRIAPLLHGGGHERGMRSGTLNVPGIAAMGEAARLRRIEMGADEPAIAARRDDLEHRLQDGFPELTVNGDVQRRLAGNLHVSFPGVPNQAIVARIRDRVALSTGSACSSGIEAPSHVLRAMGLEPDVSDGALRFGLGKFVTSRDVHDAADIVLEAVHEVKRRL